MYTPLNTADVELQARQMRAAAMRSFAVLVSAKLRDLFSVSPKGAHKAA
ncbi:hypothetical protein AQS8620_01755 [Aquimixticola soesokkakensis]|uniref:Uncharacterized protein n=1 Tax=Aquimixticola soesokkakensis TaxID=1519096 RepID=A0A1Y5SMZ8_9RHOB|nr:hypothetical protein [Aquimixticola soesokkakensis]SLN44091.1 hypothetical protein AQS8620_01755 [Aquimixticola soesokkakensis]